MQTTTTTNGQPTTQETAQQGFGHLQCPLCGEVGVTTLALDDLDTFHCAECDCDFGRTEINTMLAEVQERMAAWGKVLTWLAFAPGCIRE